MKPRPVGGSTMEMDMTPMIDVTFQLIAFFMFTINFANDLAKEEVVLPVAELAKPVEGATESPLFLNVDGAGNLLLADSTLALRDPREMANARAYLMKEAAIERKTTKNANGPLKSTLIVRAHEECECGIVQELLKVCREVGFSKFSLRALDNPLGKGA
jgi:biopolymer transport protein ExbD